MFLVAVLGTVVVVLLTFALLFRRLTSHVDAEAPNPDWLENFSMDRFAPMGRLLDPSDLKFLESQPGYRPSLRARLIRERRRAVIGYIRLLAGDFNRLIAIAKLMLIYSNEDRQEFAKALWWQQVSFHWNVLSLRCRLVLWPSVGAVDGSALLGALRNLRQQIDQLSLQQAGAV